jgi:putative flippase GtrA
VVPVHNEIRTLATSVRRLHRHLAERFPWTWRITIADNASTDGTRDEADRLSVLLENVRAVHLDTKGRGRALRAVWSASDSRVVAYTDVDLSTDLDALLPVVAPVLSGHSDLVIGSRLTTGARVQRGPRREVISRAYNRMLRLVFRNRFRDAQCGFKAIRTDVARVLLPEVQDNDWFFDTELLLLAERNGLRITEIPVDWIDDPDSRVAVARTAADDLRGMARMAVRFWTGGGQVDLSQLQRRVTPPGTGGELVNFITVGLVSTGAYLALFLWMRVPLGALPANAVALLVTCIANTAAHRRWTFDRSGTRGGRREWARAVAVYAAGLVLTSAAVLAARALDGGTTRSELVLLATASVAATALRLVLMPAWVFRSGSS